MLCTRHPGIRHRCCPTCTGAYGYGIMEVTGAGLLEYTFVDTVGAVHDTWRIVKTGL